MFQGLGSDLRYVMRVLRRSPGFVLIAVVSLAIGIGANTAMFGAIRALVLTPLPVDAPDELSVVCWVHPGRARVNEMGSTSYDADGQLCHSSFSYPAYQALGAALPPGAGLYAFAFVREFSVAVGSQPPVTAGGLMADPRYFATLRPPMALGRPFTEADDVPGAPLVTVLRHAFWMRTFGGDPSVLGRVIRVNGVSAEVVGVSAEGFTGLTKGGFFPQSDVTVPLGAQAEVVPRMSSPDEPLRTAGDAFWLRLMARVPASVSAAVASDALTATFRGIPSGATTDPEAQPSVRLIPGAHGPQPVRANMAHLLYTLMGAVGIVLLIACVNLSGLMLARVVGRRREMAVRRALGGGRVRLARQTFLEGVVLAVLGTTAGAALALVGGKLLDGLFTSSLGAAAFGTVQGGVTPDLTLLAVSAVLGLFSVMLFGLLPALRLTDLDPAAWLGHRAAGSTPKQTGGRLLIAFQIAVSVPLLVGAGLFLRTVSNLGAVDMGFDPDGLVMFRVDPAYTRLPQAQYGSIYLDVLARVEAIPGVRSATLVENALMSDMASSTRVVLDGEPHPVRLNAVGPAFVETMGMRLVEGRMPGLQDDRSAPRVAVVNETAVRDLFGGVSPVGRTVQLTSGGEVEIVGVVSDSRYELQRAEVRPTLFEAALQRDAWAGHNVVLRTDLPPARLEAAIREAVARVHPDLPVPDLRTQRAQIDATNARERVFTQLLTAFGAFALLLAAIGLYGTTSYAVTRRTSEIGVRVAMGARPGQVLWLVLRQVVVLAAVGLAVGVPIALAAGPLVRSLLFGVAPDSVPTILAATSVMLAMAIVAGLLPALRAARLDTLVALRTE